MSSDTQTQSSQFPLVVPTRTQAPLARLLVKNETGQVIQQWLVKQSKCTLGSSSSCALRCALPGIAPFHALLVIGARQTFVRALAPRITRDGTPVNEVLLSGEQNYFEAAGHRFELHRATKPNEKSPEDAAEDSRRLRFALAKPFDTAPRPKSRPAQPSPRTEDSDRVKDSRWIAKMVQSAIEPLECQIQNVLEPIAELQTQAKQQRDLLEQYRNTSNQSPKELGTILEASDRFVEDRLKQFATQQSVAIDVLTERVADVNNQLSAIENLVLAGQEDLQPRLDPTQTQQQQQEQLDAIQQLQSGMVSVSQAISQIEHRQQDAQENDQAWREDIRQQVHGLRDTISGLAEQTERNIRAVVEQTQSGFASLTERTQQSIQALAESTEQKMDSLADQTQKRIDTFGAQTEESLQSFFNKSSLEFAALKEQNGTLAGETNSRIEQLAQQTDELSKQQNDALAEISLRSEELAKKSENAANQSYEQFSLLSEQTEKGFQELAQKQQDEIAQLNSRTESRLSDISDLITQERAASPIQADDGSWRQEIQLQFAQLRDAVAQAASAAQPSSIRAPAIEEESSVDGLPVDESRDLSQEASEEFATTSTAIEEKTSQSDTDVLPVLDAFQQSSPEVDQEDPFALGSDQVDNKIDIEAEDNIDLDAHSESEEWPSAPAPAEDGILSSFEDSSSPEETAADLTSHDLATDEEMLETPTWESTEPAAAENSQGSVDADEVLEFEDAGSSAEAVAEHFDWTAGSEGDSVPDTEDYAAAPSLADSLSDTDDEDEDFFAPRDQVMDEVEDRTEDLSTADTEEALASSDSETIHDESSESNQAFVEDSTAPEAQDGPLTVHDFTPGSSTVQFSALSKPDSADSNDTPKSLALDAPTLESSETGDESTADAWDVIDSPIDTTVEAEIPEQADSENVAISGEEEDEVDFFAPREVAEEADSQAVGSPQENAHTPTSEPWMQEQDSDEEFFGLQSPDAHDEIATAEDVATAVASEELETAHADEDFPTLQGATPSEENASEEEEFLGFSTSTLASMEVGVEDRLNDDSVANELDKENEDEFVGLVATESEPQTASESTPDIEAQSAAQTEAQSAVDVPSEVEDEPAVDTANSLPSWWTEDDAPSVPEPSEFDSSEILSEEIVEDSADQDWHLSTPVAAEELDALRSEAEVESPASFEQADLQQADLQQADFEQDELEPAEEAESQIVAEADTPANALAEAEKNLFIAFRTDLDSDEEALPGNPLEESGEEDESIEDYMKQLLERMRSGPGEQAAKQVSKPTPPPKKEAKQPARSASDIEELHNQNLEDLAAVQADQAQKQQFNVEEYAPRVLAPEKVQSLAAMRELANSSARTAIHKSSRQRDVRELIFKGSIALIGFAVGSVLFAMNGLTVNLVLIATVTSFIFSLIWGIDAVTTLKPLLSSKKEKAAPDDQEAPPQPVVTPIEPARLEDLP